MYSIKVLHVFLLVICDIAFIKQVNKQEVNVQQPVLTANCLIEIVPNKSAELLRHY